MPGPLQDLRVLGVDDNGVGRVMKIVRDANPAVIMNNRLFSIPNIEKHDAAGHLLSFDRAHGDFTTPEQTVPSRGVAGVDWEQCMTMNTTRGFSEHDHAWKSDEQLIRSQQSFG